ncbi:MAG TPA: RNA polymerase sigma factor [Bryobacteraceae bacterium]|jgi:RNA polymerase sigma-70 factor (ECF subfamily)|nr:RNA polymerase sigma factor [Bryobacteraceae bacterium]
MDTLEQFAAGDLDAFEALFRQYQSEVYRWIVRLVRNPGVAEELTVETFWRVYRHQNRFDARRPFGPWARRIATRVALDYLKSVDHRESAAQLLEPVTPETQSSGPDPLLAAETRDQIARAFVSLPIRLRVAASLALIEERPYQEIADALDISLSAVKMRVARAVKHLRTSLERMGIRS